MEKKPTAAPLPAIETTAAIKDGKHREWVVFETTIKVGESGVITIRAQLHEEVMTSAQGTRLAPVVWAQHQLQLLLDAAASAPPAG